MPDLDRNLLGLFKTHVESRTLRIRELLTRYEHDALLIASGDRHFSFRDDIARPFVVNPYFSRLAPLTDVPGCFILIRQTSSKPWLFFNQPEDIWHKVTHLEPGGWTDCFTVTVCQSARASLARELSNQANLCLIGDADAFPKPLIAGGGKVNPENMLRAIDFEVGAKSEYERRCIQQANNIACRGHLAAKAAYFGGCSERRIYAEFVSAAGVKESALPYGGIVAMNENAAILHYDELSDRRLGDHERRSLLIDAGASYLGFVSDVTRTYAYSGGLFGELIEQMDASLLAIIESIRVGESYVDAHLLAHREIGQILADFGFLRCSAQNAVESGITRYFFPHGLGHFLGAQVHDPGGRLGPDGCANPPPDAHDHLRLTRQIEAGQVFILPGTRRVRRYEQILSDTRGPGAR